MPEAASPPTAEIDADMRALLLESAAWAGDLAETVYATSGPQPCADFHVAWQELRLLGLAAGPERHEAFFSREFARLARARRDRVLIAGAADYGMLACVHRGYAGHPPSVVVVDLCATPLMLCAWYGATRSLPVLTMRADLARITPDPHWAKPGFDLVTSHSTLRYFDPADRPRVLARWRQLLRPGGRLVTATRLHPSAGATAPDPADHVERFVGGALRASVTADVDFIDRDRLARRAARFARAGHFHSTRSAAEVADAFETAGYRIERLDETVIDGRLDDAAAAPGTARRARYAAWAEPGRRAYAFTEGGYCTLYRVGMALDEDPDAGPVDRAIAAASRVVYDDEWAHMLEGIAGLDGRGMGDADWDRLTRLSVEQSRARLHMRNAQFSHPVGTACMAELESGGGEPIAFDWARAGFEPPR